VTGLTRAAEQKTLKGLRRIEKDITRWRKYQLAACSPSHARNCAIAVDGLLDEWINHRDYLRQLKGGSL